MRARINLRVWLFALTIAFTASLVPANGFAQANRVERIDIEGNQRIESATIRSYMLIQAGDNFDGGRLDRSLKSLFATGLFADVALRREGQTLVVRVVENPIINRIAFEGNRAVNDQILQSEVQLRPRVVYTRTKVQQDVERLLTIYRRSGRFAATIAPKIIRLPQNRVDLVFEINEGDATEVRRINFVGNRIYGDGDLRGEILTRESRWWRFLSSSDNYDPDRLSFDQERLRRFYLRNGYADFSVRSAVAELSPAQRDFFITFMVEEGARYRFGAIDVTSAIPELPADAVRPELLIETGDWYDSEAVEDTVQALTDAVGNLGYAFVDIRPSVNRNAEDRTIDITFEIQEGPRVFVERVEIVGNVRTLDKVVRREMTFVEGDAFNRAKIRRTRRDIQNLGYFKRVEITPTQGTASDQAVVEIEVEEQSTGSLSIGVGVSTTDGAIVEVSLQERNLLGRGQTLRLSTALSTDSTRIDLGFTEPFLFGRPLTGGIDLFFDEEDLQDESSFDEERIGMGLRMGYDIAEDLRHIIGYSLVQSEIDNVDDSASLFVKGQEGQSVTSSLFQSITYDKRDNRVLPSDGYMVRLSNEVAGLGGSVNYLRYRLSGQYLIPLETERWVVSVDGATGWVGGLNEDVRIVDRFFLGGDSLRGFDSAGVGPRDESTEDALGGRMFYNGTASLRFPLEVFENAPLTGRTFTDFGSLWDPEEAGAGVLDENSLRASVGVGISWRAPVGLINVDVAQPLLKEDFDQTEFLRFSFGTNF